MLKILRNKKVSRYIFWALVILILPAFVLWGSGSLGRGGGPSCVGEIDNKKITFEDFYKSLLGVRVQIILNYFDKPETLEAFLKNRAFLGRLAWDRLILMRETKKEKIRIPNSAIVTYVKDTNPIFLRDGRFDEQIYEYILRNNMGLDPRTFEEIVRQNLAIQELNDRLTRDITVTGPEVEALYKRDHQKFKIAYLYVPASDFTSEVAVTDDETAAYYEAHKQELVVPVKDDSGKETMRAASFEDAKDDITVFLTEQGGRGLAVEAAVKRRAELAALIAPGTAFAEAATEAGMAAPVETDFVGKADYLEGIGEAEPLIAAAARLGPGELSGVIETRKGALFFKIVDMQEFDRATFDAEKNTYTKEALRQKKELFVTDWLRQREDQTSLNINLEEYQQYYH